MEKIGKLENYEEKREEGQSTNLKYNFIRKDSLKDFIRVFLSAELSNSFFETNQFLLNKKPAYIEYTAFFGSMKIFEYLKTNYKVNPSLCIYAVHSGNINLIQMLENSMIENKEYNMKQPIYNFYKDLLIESIKCHHNDIATYILEKIKLYDNDHEVDDIVISNCFCYYNFLLLP